MVTCPKCGSHKICRDGFDHLKNGSKVQIYKCSRCQTNWRQSYRYHKNGQLPKKKTPLLHVRVLRKAQRSQVPKPKLSKRVQMCKSDLKIEPVSVFGKKLFLKKVDGKIVVVNAPKIQKGNSR